MRPEQLLAHFAAAQAVLQQALASIAQHIQVLYQAGARNFLVWLPPDVALTPAIRTLDGISPGVAQLASALTQAFNGGLVNVLAQLSMLPGITIRQLDAYALLHALVADPQTYGLSNVTRPCVTPDVPPFFCRQADEYLFWDGIHPTRAVHTITAAAGAAALGQ